MALSFSIPGIRSPLILNQQISADIFPRADKPEAPPE